jgi:hypothetical protein
MICNSILDNYHVEMEKDTIWQELEATNQDSKETLMENVYYDNIRQINRDMVVNFRTANYFGENIVIVGTGAVDH